MNQKAVNLLLAIGISMSLGLNFYLLNKDKKIVYVDIQKLVLNNKKMQAQLNDNQSLEKTVKARLDTLGHEILVLSQELATAHLSQAERQQKEEMIKRLKMDKARYQQQSLNGMQEKDQKKMQEILAKTNTLLKEYAKQHDYAYVMGATQMGNLLYAEDKANITDQVLAEINRK